MEIILQSIHSVLQIISGNYLILLGDYLVLDIKQNTSRLFVLFASVFWLLDT